MGAISETRWALITMSELPLYLLVCYEIAKSQHPKASLSSIEGATKCTSHCSPHPVHESHRLGGLLLRSPSKRPDETDETRSWQSVQSGPDYLEHWMNS